MGTVRNVVKWLVSSILILALILTIYLVALVKWSEYENLRSVSYRFLESTIRERISYEEVSALCQNKENLEFSVEDLGNISIPCSEIKEENFLQPFVYAVFDKLYYKKYDCEFLECMEQTPLVILSAKTNAFLKSLQTYMIVSTCLLVVAYLAIAENMKERFKGLGSIFTFCGIQFFITEYMLSLMHLGEVKEILDTIFSQVYIYFAITAVAGVVLLALSILFKEKTLINKK
jgi:hypothetical protein